MPDEPPHREVVAALGEDEGDAHDEVVVQQAHDPGDPARVDVVAAAGRERGREPVDDLGRAARFEAPGERGGQPWPQGLLRDARGDPGGQQPRHAGDAVVQPAVVVEERGDGPLAEEAHVVGGQLFEEGQPPRLDVQQPGELQRLGPAPQNITVRTVTVRAVTLRGALVRAAAIRAVTLRDAVTRSALVQDALLRTAAVRAVTLRDALVRGAVV
ncbi:hypothetical protein FGF04_22710 [Streptomyces apricus]|uniref:Pentapeptide repeat-containing protein n=1 Tax=Streptomyces apricus TaxID=1828112 RepID=A0A5B0AQX3_9ACTN|nr:hypothetical protein FGF04_22710 [Streptomyces apricus]